MDLERTSPTLESTKVPFYAQPVVTAIWEKIPPIVRSLFFKSKDFVEIVALPRTLSQHSMTGILQVFKEEIEFGVPIRKDKILNWPLGTIPSEQFYRFAYTTYTNDLRRCVLVDLSKLSRAEEVFMRDVVIGYKVEEIAPFTPSMWSRFVSWSKSLL